MNEIIQMRIRNMANLMLENKLTVRSVAQLVGISKSTVHKDLTERLGHIDHDLYLQVNELLEYNKKIRHIRGGQSTKEKYAQLKK